MNYQLLQTFQRKQPALVKRFRSKDDQHAVKAVRSFLQKRKMEGYFLLFRDNTVHIEEFHGEFLVNIRAGR